MSGIDRFERELPDALTDVAGGGRPDYLADLLGRTAATTQRPAWASLERWLPMELTTRRASIARIPWRYLAVAAALVLLGVLAALFAGSQQRRIPPPFGPAANGVIPYGANGDIFIGDPATGQTRSISPGPENDYGPTFSPDGTHVAFLRASANCPKPGEDCPGGEDIMVAATDGDGLRAISAQPVAGIRYAAWSPDSRALYVSEGAADVYRLVSIPIDGSAPREIATGLEVDWIVFRPPAGDEMLVRGVVHSLFGVWRLRADGSDVQLLAAGASPGETLDNNQDLNFPSYSPDGSLIYYNRYTSPEGTIQAWVMNGDGSNQHRFNAASPSCCAWEGEMAPSPDGKWVVMWRVPAGSTGEITLFPADGSGLGRKIGPPAVGTAHWLWSPDSSKVLLNFNDATEGDEGLIDPATGAFSTLPWHADAEPDWQRQARP